MLATSYTDIFPIWWPYALYQEEWYLEWARDDDDVSLCGSTSYESNPWVTRLVNKLNKKSGGCLKSRRHDAADLFHTGLMVDVQGQVGTVPCKTDFQNKCMNIVRFRLWWLQTIGIYYLVGGFMKVGPIYTLVGLKAKSELQCEYRKQWNQKGSILSCHKMVALMFSFHTQHQKHETAKSKSRLFCWRLLISAHTGSCKPRTSCVMLFTQNERKAEWRVRALPLISGQR